MEVFEFNGLIFAFTWALYTWVGWRWMGWSDEESAARDFYTAGIILAFTLMLALVRLLIGWAT